MLPKAAAIANRTGELVLYAGYSGYTLRPREFTRLLRLAADENGRSRAKELGRVTQSHFRHQTHPLDYFHLRLFREPIPVGGLFANTWEMHQFHRRFNHAGHIETLRNKQLFRERMSEFTAGGFTSLESPNVLGWLRSRTGRRFVAKRPTGSAGTGISIHAIETTPHGIELDGTAATTVLARLRRNGQTLLEDYLEQHMDLSAMYDGSLNTVRVITFLTDDGQVDVWAALLRLGCEGPLDNFHAGGVTALVDIASGVTHGPLIRMNPFTPALDEKHPTTGVRVIGRVLPHWDEGLDLIQRAAKANPRVRTVGWDLALLTEGPAILEGNDNWDKTQWQLGTGAPHGDLIRRHLER